MKCKLSIEKMIITIKKKKRISLLEIIPREEIFANREPESCKSLKSFYFQKWVRNVFYYHRNVCNRLDNF